MSTLILTRPLADSQAMSAMLEPRGINCLIAPALEFDPYLDGVSKVQAYRGKPVQAIIVTSRHALTKFTPADLPDTPIYCVGEHTAFELGARGFAVQAGGENANDLTEFLRGRVTPGAGPVLYLSGEDIAQHLDELLAPDGIEVTRLITYRAKAVRAMPAEVSDAIRTGEADAVCFFSRRSGTAFLTQLGNAGMPEAPRKLAALCLSQDIAHALARQQWHEVQVATRPTLDRMLVMIHAYYEK